MAFTRNPANRSGPSLIISAIVFDDKNHESALALCRLFAERRDLTAAIHTLRISLFRDQRSPKLNLALARLLERRANILRRSRKWTAENRFLEEACRCYRIAIASAPTTRICVALGRLEQRLERHELSKSVFEKAVNLNPRSAVALTHLANAYVESGEIDEAIETFDKSLAIDPRRADTHFRYSRAKRFQPGATSAAYMQTLTMLISETDRPPHERIQLNFALAKVLDDLGDYKAAWQHYDQANRLKPGHGGRSDSSQKSPLANIVSDAMRCYTPHYFESKRAAGNPSTMPVFIVGMPRSGTTLTEQILSSHPAIAGAGELKQIERIRQQIVRESRCNRNPQDGRAGSLRPATALGRVYPEIMTSLPDDRLRELADQHLLFLDSLRQDRDHVTDKMPTNFMHLGLIATLFPNATIVHCRRDPMDVLVSCYCQNLSAPFCDLDALVYYHRAYRRLMALWQAVLPLKIHTVDYESLVTDPEPNARAMIEHCGLTWDERCLAFQANRRTVHTPSKWQVRQPMYSSSIDRWKRFQRQLEDISRQIEQDLIAESAAA